MSLDNSKYVAYQHHPDHGMHLVRVCIIALLYAREIGGITTSTNTYSTSHTYHALLQVSVSDAALYNIISQYMMILMVLRCNIQLQHQWLHDIRINALLFNFCSSMPRRGRVVVCTGHSLHQEQAYHWLSAPRTGPAAT